jgi:hypothetical protein
METASVTSTLDAVTIYAQGAICTRIARFAPTGAGMPRQVRVAGLPISARGNSLRARVTAGPPGLGVQSVQGGFDCELPPDSDMPAEEVALEKATDALQRLEWESALTDEEASRLATLRPEFPKLKRGDPPREAPVSAMLALGDFVEARLAELAEQRLRLDRELLDARNEVELRQRRLAEASSAKRVERARLTRTAIVTFTASGAPGPIELAVEYFVPGARWAPTYELALDRSLGSGTLRMRATAVQRSGEDWKNVRLSFSTADLDRRVELPELRSLRIGRAQPAPPRSGWREPPAGLDELFAGYDGAMPRTFAGRVPSPASPAFGARDRPKGGPAKQKPSHRDEPAYATDGLLLDEGGAVGSGAATTVAASEQTPPAGIFVGGAMARAVPPPMPAAPAAAPARSAARPMAVAKSAMVTRGRAHAKSEDVEASLELAEPEGALANQFEASPPPPPPPEEELGDALLDYGLLAMAGVNDSPRRGRLVPRPSEWSIDIATLARLSIQVDVLSLVSLRQREADQVSALPLPGYGVPVRKSAGSYDYRYDTEHRVDLESDGTWHTVPIFAAEVTLEPEYVAVPSVEPRVYRTVRVTNNSTYALLAGPADVKLGNEFLMTVPFPTVPPRGKSRVGLGVEEAIKISRNTRFSESAGGLLGGSAVLAHAVEIEVANRLGQVAAIEVRERVPVPAEKEIHVEETKLQPPWEVDDEARDGSGVVEGGRRWRIRLGAAETAKLLAEFTVRIPAGKTLMGGNRRI